MLTLRRGLRRGPRHLGHPGPEPARGTELRDRQELVGVGRVAELQLAERGVDGQPGGGERAQVRDAGGEGAAELLRGGGAGLVVREGVDDEGAQLREALGTAGRQGGGVGEQRLGAPGQAGAGLQAQRVGAEVARGGAGGDLALLVELEQLLGGLGEFRSRVEHDAGQVEVDAGQGLGQGRDRQGLAAQLQPERAAAVLQVGEDRLVGAARVRVGVPLADVPAGHRTALRPTAADERREAGVAGLGRGVLGGVQGAGAQPVLECGGERLLGRCAVGGLRTRLSQHALDEVLPLLAVCGREFGGQGSPSGGTVMPRRLAPVRVGAAEAEGVTFPSLCL